MKHEFPTASGMILRLKPVPSKLLDLAALAIEERYRKAGEPIDPPTYRSTGKVLGDEPMEIPLTAAILEVTGNEEETQRRKAVWARYEQARAKLASEQMEARYTVMLALGVDVELPDDEEWIEQIRWVKSDPTWEPPKDKRDRKAFWLAHSVLSDIEHAMLLGEMSMEAQAGEVDEELLKNFREAPRRQMGRIVRDAVKQFESSVEQVGQQHEVPGSANS